MARDIAELRETEAKAEKERIVDLKPAEIKPQPSSVPSTPFSPTLPLPPLKENKPAFSFPYKKIIVRGVIVLISLSLLGFGFWLWQVKKPPEEKIIPPAQKVLPQEEPEKIIQAPIIQERLVNLGFRNTTATRTIDTIIIHSIYNTLGGDLYDVEKVIQEHQKYKTSNHYLIDRDGSIYRLVLDKDVAYQAGTGIMPDGSRKNIINSFSLGIELIYTKTESPNEAQYQSLAKLVNYLKQQYNIPSENILANNQINPGRKDDPWNFDWEYLNSLIK